MYKRKRTQGEYTMEHPQREQKVEQHVSKVSIVMFLLLCVAIIIIVFVVYFKSQNIDIKSFTIKDFVKNNFSYSLLKKSWKVINPSLRKPVIDLSKILLVSGKYDKYVIDKDTDTLWKNWGKPERYLYSCGHSGIVLSKNMIKKDILKFIDKRV